MHNPAPATRNLIARDDLHLTSVSSCDPSVSDRLGRPLARRVRFRRLASIAEAPSHILRPRIEDLGAAWAAHACRCRQQLPA